MARKCDVCLKTIPRNRGYALTTTQVATTPAYWEYAFTHQWAYVGKQVKLLDVTIQAGETLENLVQMVASDYTPWLICDSCIKLFKVDRNQCLKLAKHFTAEMPNGWQQITGPGDLKETFSAAKKAYRSVF